MVITQICSLYRDANDLRRTVIKHVYEAWNPALEQWHLQKIEFLFPDNDLPLHTDRPEAAVEHQHGWIVPPTWEFISEVREFERKSESDLRDDHESAVEIIR